MSRLMAKASGLRWKARRTVRLNGQRYAPGAFVPFSKATPEKKEQLIEQDRVFPVTKDGTEVREEGA